MNAVTLLAAIDIQKADLYILDADINRARHLTFEIYEALNHCMEIYYLVWDPFLQDYLR